MLNWMEGSDRATFSVKRDLLSQIAELSQELVEPMHELLERNAEGMLGNLETAELRALVHIAAFGQVVSLALQGSGDLTA